jgi:hypothetical protein
MMATAASRSSVARRILAAEYLMALSVTPPLVRAPSRWEERRAIGADRPSE